MNSWRPDGWDAEDIYATTEWIGMEQTDLVEAGADAIVEAQKEEGQYVQNTGTSPYGIALVRQLKLGEKGWIVFIPDEVKQ